LFSYKNKAAVVIPIYKEKISDNELLSLKQCFKVLGKHSIIFVAPKSLNMLFYEGFCRQNSIKFEVKTFEDRFFQNTRGYNELLKTGLFYKEFLKYEYMLIYQLDAYVFRDDLLYWCGKGYDYIGAPWFEGYSAATEESKFLPYAGNGGFSLRKIRTLYKIFSAGVEEFYLANFPNFYENYHPELSFFQKLLKHKQILADFASFHKNYLTNMNINKLNNEDLVICFLLPKFYKKLNIANPEISKYFSFEVMPKRLYRETNNSLPFGCHAWEKYDPEFWKEFIIKH